MPDRETLSVYDSEAPRYATMVSSKKPEPALRSFMEALPKGGNALDLGCGPGNSAHFMRQAGFTVDATDGSPEMVKLANETYDIGARIALFDDITGEAVYDGIWANFSLLHAPRADFPRYLKALSNALKPGGVFHIGMKTGVGEKRDRIGRFYTYYKENELKDHLKQVGLEVCHTRKGEQEGLAGDIEPWVTLLAHKQATPTA